MHSVILTGRGGLDKLEYRDDVPVPQPRPDEVLIEVTACGVNNTDINTRTGWYAASVKTGLTKEIGLSGALTDSDETRFPRIQGADAVGRIAAVGAGVPRERIGQRVMVDPCIRDPARPRTAQGISYFGTDRDGGFAQYAVIPSGNAWSVNSSLDDISLASFACSYSTAEEMLERTQLHAGDTVLITGAAGGVGTAAIQLAKLRGARIVAVAGAEKESKVRSLGADHFIARQTPDLYRGVVDLFGKHPVTVVVDVAGGPNTGLLLRLLGPAGRFATAGAISGPIAEIDLRQIIYKDLEIYGVTNPQAETFRRLVAYIEAGQLKPLVEETYALKDVALAQRILLDRSHFGKLVIRVNEGPVGLHSTSSLRA
jgi:NADPH:quinone reductase-like Zn-dependent oxidoreductase